MTKWRSFDRTANGEINLPRGFFKEQTWTQNHVFTNFNLCTLQHYH